MRRLSDNMLGVTVIGGYLGAGKTTLVNHLLRHADGMKIAVLVNEFGALPIDADLIEAQDENLISIAGGCVCCSYGNDLIRAMMALANMTPQPNHVLVEASGIALPGAIAASVSVMDGFDMDGIVVLADAETIQRQAQDPYIGDTIERQLADAQLVLLNKTDLIASTQVQEVTTWLGTQAPEAAVVAADYAGVPNAVILQKHPHASTDNTPSSPHEDAVFESRVIQFDQDSDAERVARALADPALALVRAKGFVPTPDGMRAIQIVGRRWTVSEAPQGAAAGVVVITQRDAADWDHFDKTIQYI